MVLHIDILTVQSIFSQACEGRQISIAPILDLHLHSNEMDNLRLYQVLIPQCHEWLLSTMFIPLTPTVHPTISALPGPVKVYDIRDYEIKYLGSADESTITTIRILPHSFSYAK